MINSIFNYSILYNGVKMPWLGLGVFKASEGGELEQAIKIAVQTGYRSIDTAAMYGNEEGVGRAIKDCGVAREELFITTKVWNDDHGFGNTLAAFERSQKKLDLDYIDLYLIHWPVEGKYKDTWRALEQLYKDGKVRAIGVCNFKIHHLEELMTECELTPMVNQVEFHPLLNQKELNEFCKTNKIQLEAWSPLMKGDVVNQPALVNLAEKYGKTPAQIVLRWDLQNGVVAIPKSVNEKRIRENADIFDFEISSEDMSKIDELNMNKRYGPDPDKFNF